MEQIIFGISNKLNEKVTKKQFLKESGIFIIGITMFPNLINYFLKNKRLRMEGNNIFLDDELIIERREE
jgi:hypothetical protein